MLQKLLFGKKDALVLLFFAILLAMKWWGGKGLPSVGDETNFIVMIEDGMRNVKLSSSFSELIQSLYFFSSDYPPLYLWIASFFYDLFVIPLVGMRFLCIIFMFVTTACFYSIIKISTQSIALAIFGVLCVYSSPVWLVSLAIMDTAMTAVTFFLFLQVVIAGNATEHSNRCYFFIGCTLAIGFLLKFNFIIYAFPIVVCFSILEIMNKNLDMRSSWQAGLCMSTPSIFLALPWYVTTLLRDNSFINKYATGIFFILKPSNVQDIFYQVAGYATANTTIYSFLLLCIAVACVFFIKKDKKVLFQNTFFISAISFVFCSIFLFYFGRYWIARWNLTFFMFVLLLCVMLSSLKIKQINKSLLILFLSAPLSLAAPSAWHGFPFPKTLARITTCTFSPKSVNVIPTDTVIIGAHERSSPNAKLVYSIIDKHYTNTRLSRVRVLYFADPHWIIGYSRAGNALEAISTYSLYNIFPQLLESALKKEGYFYFVISKEWRTHPKMLHWFAFLQAWDDELWNHFEKLPNAPTTPGEGQEIYYTDASRFPASAFEKLAEAARHTDTDFPAFHSLTEARYKLANGTIDLASIKNVLLETVWQWQNPDVRWKCRNDVLGMIGAMQALGSLYWEKTVSNQPVLSPQALRMRQGEKLVSTPLEQLIPITDGSVAFSITPPQEQFGFMRVTFDSPGGYTNVVYNGASGGFEIGAYDATTGRKTFVYPLPHTAPIEEIWLTSTVSQGEYRIVSIDFLE